MTPDELLRTIQYAEVKGWTRLDLSHSGLTELPSEIGHLTNLTELNLASNPLSQLPSEIATLSKLTRLDLSNNQLSQLPPEIGALANLCQLYLIGNQLSQLPSEIAALANLTELDLSYNQLSQLPSEIGTLANLTQLDLSYNRLSELPPEISVISHLIWLDLSDNQLPIPPEILRKTNDPAAILNYYFQTEHKKALNEAKMLVVGQAGVGKTSLIKRLLYHRFDLQEDKTEGIKIQNWPIQIEERQVQLNVWDFGGQEIMHATHQFFLTHRSLYLLVLDNRLGEDDNRLEYWLKMIQSFGGESPVLVVGNKLDQQGLDLDRRGLQLKYPRIKGFVETSCQTGMGIEALQAAIAIAIAQLNHVNDELPQNWFAVKQQLERLERDYLPYRDYEHLCQAQGIDDDLSRRTLIGFLHDLGIVLNFQDDPRLEDTNILNPVWVTNGVYRILNDNALMTQHRGMLERGMLERILDSERYPRNKQLFIIDMMRKFELCFDLEGFRDERFLIPDLLSKEEPDTGDWGASLAFQYHYNVLPGSVISRFIVRASGLISKQTYWRSGVVLAYEDSRALVKADREDRTIFIAVDGAQARRRQLLGIIRAHFDHIHGTIGGLAVAEKVPLPGHPGIILDYQDLLGFEAAGELWPFVPRLGGRVDVKQLLDGIEGVRDRRQQVSERERFLARERDLYRQQSEDLKQIAQLQAKHSNTLDVSGLTVNLPEAQKEETHYHAPVGSVGNRGHQHSLAGNVASDQISHQHHAASVPLSGEEEGTGNRERRTNEK